MSCLSTLVFTPAMAQEVEDVHAEALKVLREQMARPITNSISSRPSIAESRRIEGEVRRDRDERNMLLREQAEAERARRNELHEQKRQEFEQELREREFLRQRQQEYDESIARQMRALNPGMPVEDVHSQALSVLRGQAETTPETTLQAAQPVAAPIQPAAAPAAVVKEQQSPEELHQRALEILRQGQPAELPQAAEPTPQRTVVPAVIPPRTTEAAPVAAPASPAVDDAYIKELERRALEVVGSSSAQQAEPAPVAAPAAPAAAEPVAVAPASTDLPASEVHDKALQALRQQYATPAPVTSQPTQPVAQPSEAQTAFSARNTSTTTTARAEAPRASTPAELEAQARQVLRQQQAEISASNTPAPAASVPAEPSGNEQYSRDLEERARQILAERAQAQQTAPVVASPEPAPNQAAPAVATPSSTPIAEPVTTPAESADIHLRALEALRQGTSNGASATLTKREKLRALTDLYRADKIGSAEYHQKRAEILAEPGE